MSSKPRTIKIESVAHAGAHKLRLCFSDGKEQVVDFGPFLKHSRHPEIRKFLGPRTFKQYTLKDGELMWGDFDLIFPIMDLYENNLDRRGRPIADSYKRT